MVRRRNARAQAALEFIMTYGWALMGILILSGVLIYYSVPRSSVTLCEFGSSFRCTDAYMNDFTVPGKGVGPHNEISFELRNILGTDIINVGIKELELNPLNIACNKVEIDGDDITVGELNALFWAAGDDITISTRCIGPDRYDVGDDISLVYVVEYQLVGDTVTHEVRGNIRGKVIPAEKKGKGP